MSQSVSSIIALIVDRNVRVWYAYFLRRTCIIGAFYLAYSYGSNRDRLIIGNFASVYTRNDWSLLSESHRLLSIDPAGKPLTGKPGRPSSVTVEGTSVSLEWTAPHINDGHEIVGYVITYGVVGSDPDQFEKEDVGKAVTAYTFSGLLQPQTSYVFAVAAKTVDGEGPLSDFSDPVHTYTGYYSVVARVWR